MNHIDGRPGYTLIEADVPMSEMLDFAVNLRATSQGLATYSFDFDHYEEAPAPVMQKIIDSAPKKAD